MKVAIVGSSEEIEAKAKAIAERLGKDVEIVVIDDAEMKLPKFDNEPFILENIKMVEPPFIPKRKGHERPYKYHR